MGEVTGGRLEIKTSGRYTYEMGVALSRSEDPADQALWRDWHRFTADLALLGAFSPDPTERGMARSFIVDALDKAGKNADVFGSPQACRAALESLPPSPDHMFCFEYNFLFVLAAGGRAEKAALGDHSPRGYAQRARFYSISDGGPAPLREGGRRLHRVPRRAYGPGPRRAVRGRPAAPRADRGSHDEFLAEISR